MYQEDHLECTEAADPRPVRTCEDAERKQNAMIERFEHERDAAKRNAELWQLTARRCDAEAKALRGTDPRGMAAEILRTLAARLFDSDPAVAAILSGAVDILGRHHAESD